MPAERAIRADFDRESITIYQAFSPAIADAALAAGRFVPPFSTNRMTWIKPSFSWLMHRSRWGQKAGQERILAVRMTRIGWERALSLAVPTAFEPTLFRSADDWSDRFGRALVHLQWDTERSPRGAALPCFSIQVGLSRHIIREYVESWTLRIVDLTPVVAKIRSLHQSGHADQARRLLPPERPYSVPADLARRIMLTP